MENERVTSRELGWSPGERAVLASGALYLLGSATLAKTLGLFHATWLPVYALGFVAWAVVVARCPEAPRRAPRDLELALLVACALGAWYWTTHAVLADARRVPALKTFRDAPWLVIALCGLAAFARRPWWPIAAAIGVVLYAKSLIVETSPLPFIDVFTSNTHAADHFLAGRNPYTQRYPDIYGGGHDYRPGMVYWPAVLLWQSASRAFGGDIRWGALAADLITTAALVAAAARAGLSLRVALLAALAWLLSPVGPFVFEQAWVDPLLTMTFALFACAMAFERALLAGCALGLCVACKQYGALGAFVGAAYALRVFGAREMPKVLGAAAISFSAITLPVALRDLDAFIEMTVRVPGRMGLRRDALSLLVFAAERLRGTLPTTITLAAAGLSTLAAAAWLHRLPRPTLAHFAAATAVAYAGLFFFGKQAFCNYHHFLMFFVVLHFVGALSEAPSQAPSTRRASSVRETPAAPTTPTRSARRRRRRGLSPGDR